MSDHWPEVVMDWIMDYWVGWPIDLSKRIPPMLRIIALPFCLAWIPVALFISLPVQFVMVIIDIPLLIWDEMQ